MAQNIKLNSLNFPDENKFRKFTDLTVPFAKRLTLLCGHNGTGKSTILGVIASLSGVHNPEVSAYSGKPFDANISDIIYIDYVTEGQAIQSQPVATYTINGVSVQKKCTLTKPRRLAVGRARSVPRTVSGKDFNDGKVKFGAAAKVPLPTIYLGMVRMIPLGEIADSRIVNVAPEEWDQEDEDYLIDFSEEVIPSLGKKTGGLATNVVKSTGKISTVPARDYHCRSVSLGQDSLGGIATALASFNRIKRETGDAYPGGLLIIDEMDAGFHPNAIGRLVEALRNRADELNLQIVATTHSTRLIEAIHRDGRSSAKHARKDSVIYLLGTRSPKIDLEMSLAEIMNDMDLTPPAQLPPPEIRIYFEDDEACQVFGIVASEQFISSVEAQHGVKLLPMPLGVGCSSLAMLPIRDEYFTSVVLVADADGPRPDKLPQNLVELPAGTDPDGEPLSPERTLMAYIRDLVENEHHHKEAWSDPRLRRISTDNLEEQFLRGFDPKIKRKPAKTWWTAKFDLIERWGLYNLWCNENQAKVRVFLTAFANAVETARKAQTALRYKQFRQKPEVE